MNIIVVEGLHNTNFVFEIERDGVFDRGEHELGGENHLVAEWNFRNIDSDNHFRCVVSVLVFERLELVAV